ncbi:MAG TPA: protein-L-isoaspartate(D-aspartate) O-methyltransferase [Desulfobacterales bacterium]|nr:protein-L-isoaspartate(D-aspartate) O-methyltransferase [Desulfobacterales bacterium]
MKTIFSVFFAFILIPAMSAGEIPLDSPAQKAKRTQMISDQIIQRGIADKKVIRAMSEVPRHLFVPEELTGKAYSDRPLPIGEGQTISQPYIVALMTESLNLEGDERVLEIGTGSGYQAAILAAIVKEVFTIEIKKSLYKRSINILNILKIKNIKTRHGDGYFGWEESTPFDCIMITAAIDHIPPPLLKQLKNGGKLILPLGNPFSYQNLVLVTKQEENYRVRQITGVLFVPMTGYALDRFTKPSGDMQ